jgi:sulfonate transport system substrate-binding protein
MITRRQALALLGSTTAAAVLPFGAPARASTSTIRIGWQKFGVLALAKEQGALEKRLASKGVSVEWSEFSSGPPLLEALGAGALDFGPTGDVPPLFAQAAGGSLLYVGTYRPPAAFHGLLVHKESPIQKIADLKGKKIAYKRGSSAHNFAFKALATADLTPEDITSVDLAPPDAAAAFKNGSVDGWAIWDPFFAVAQSDPDTRLLVTSEGIVDAWGYFLGNTDFTNANPEIISDILDELAKVARTPRRISTAQPRRFLKSPASRKRSPRLRSPAPDQISARLDRSLTRQSLISKRSRTISSNTRSCRSSSPSPTSSGIPKPAEIEIFIGDSRC